MSLRNTTSVSICGTIIFGCTRLLGVQLLVGAGNFAVLTLILFDLTGNEKLDHIGERTVFLRCNLFDFAVGKRIKPHSKLGFYYCHSIISLNYHDTIFPLNCMVSILCYYDTYNMQNRVLLIICNTRFFYRLIQFCVLVGHHKDILECYNKYIKICQIMRQ